ncbi:DNA topoisomerase IV, alpha subunit [Polychaeton citri CBS 116435]|uniref:DNA topoisomerase (ATP-hydrolyzing) n=1 Tax=Polychaeton citri CBS 116435 TaxID=1314669 RepID=A0A9P4QHZ4_9PEZI|nr:DNA topoisomerase IV, alpha subunit [Polychaeton citri CBS 116435]
MEAWRFSVVIRILEITHEAQHTGRSISKRDIYYRDPALFGKQCHVDQYVDDIAYTFNVPRSSLNISAAAKGLIAGAIIFHRRDGSMTDISQDKEGTLIPPLSDLLSVGLDSIRWILVIEKEATFRTVTAGPLWPLISMYGVVITGKGYPDIATRALLHGLVKPSSRNNFAAPPAYGLSDFDPDGCAIMSTYKNGSEALSHENTDLTCPTLQWVGLRSNSISKLCAESGDVHLTQGFLTMTTRDRYKAKRMLQWGVLDDGSQIDHDWRRELQTMLVLNVKAELQLLEATRGGTAALLEDVFLSQR